MDVDLLIRRAIDPLKKLGKWHVAPESHRLHGSGHLVEFKDFVVVSGNQPVERISDKAEAEVRATTHPCCVLVHHAGFPFGGFAPKRIRGGPQSLLRVLRQ